MYWLKQQPSITLAIDIIKAVIGMRHFYADLESVPHDVLIKSVKNDGVLEWFQLPLVTPDL